MLYDLKYFSIVASFLSVIRFFIIYFLYKSSFNLKKSFFFKRLTPFLLAIIAQMFVFSIFGSLTYLRIYEHSPILYEQFCFIIILISFILSFIIFKSKERQLKLQYELKYKEKLAIVNERNRISRELHDTLGHTLTLLITLIKSSRINIKKDTEGTEKKLVQAASIASEGLKQIRTTISGWLPDKLNSSPITTEINKLIEFAKDIGIEIDFSVYGEERIVATGYSDVLYKICREAITNSLRHGKAKKVTIVLKFFQEKIQLFITDDGIGCNNIKKGFGLIGIEERVNDMNGTLTYGTTGDRGFNIHAKFPISKEGFR
ncbi:integral membrane sensor signal transduction histidine kinase [Pseudobacteroides cellulosolvens ATCC 35603 = DSM 2933]|nr:integral membrane sensor signal transduction histidine kinase [Pseudobacteroides cellulosolvens ATCC 35603 = DSM 2933]